MNIKMLKTDAKRKPLSRPPMQKLNKTIEKRLKNSAFFVPYEI